jgi:hypothetical protein
MKYVVEFEKDFDDEQPSYSEEVRTFEGELRYELNSQGAYDIEITRKEET